MMLNFNFLENYKIDAFEAIIDDCFLNFCDEYNQDTYIDYGYLVNDSWVGKRMIKDVMKLAKEEGVNIDLKKAYRISIYNKQYRENIEGQKLSELSDVWRDEINIDFTNCIDRIQKLSNNRLVPHLVNRLNPLHWGITFFMVYID